MGFQNQTIMLQRFYHVEPVRLFLSHSWSQQLWKKSKGDPRGGIARAHRSIPILEKSTQEATPLYAGIPWHAYIYIYDICSKNNVKSIFNFKSTSKQWKRGLYVPEVTCGRQYNAYDACLYLYSVDHFSGTQHHRTSNNCPDFRSLLKMTTYFRN